MSEPDLVPAEGQQRPDDPWWRWWSSLEHRKGDRAALRRCRSVRDVALEPAFHDVLKRLGKGWSGSDRERIAAAVGVLAQVEQNSPARSLADAMASPKGDKPTVSDFRFRRLLRLETPDELLHELPRIIRQLGGAAPISQLARDLMRWDDDVRKRWALHYYEKANLS
ncbi:MAG: type I-E CRISPR-associated protein Cse2/CasB [Deltaproteobacteria bacterium]|nr:type I-E CRISPR-associated protein Cse2/CasB [Deltaproteobacteria bacterium]